MAENGRRGWEDEERGPGALHHGFVLMEALVEKLKILNCDQELLEKHNMKPLSRHYFVSSPYLAANPGEQFYVFTIMAAWLINSVGRSFTRPQEDDEPTATSANILAELRALGVKVDFPPSKLKSGSGEHVCFVLNALAEHVLKRRGFSFKRPNYPTETTEEESVMDDHAELMLNDTDHIVEEDDEDEDNLVDLEALTLQSTLREAAAVAASKPDEIMRSTLDVAEWNLEVERVLPLLKVTIRTDNKDWRVHVDQMHQHQDAIKSSLHEAKGYIGKLEEDISRTLEKVSSREKYMNKQLEGIISEHRAAQAKLGEVRELYQRASGGVAQRTRLLAELSEELEKVKQEMEERGSSMSDGGMFSSFGSAEDTMQTCVNMGATSWEASAHTMWNHPSAKNLYQYQKNGGADRPTAVPGQDGRYYQNVSRVPQTTFSAVPQGGNYGHQFVSSRVFNDKIGQKSSMWTTGGVAQRETVPFRNPTSPSWNPSGVVYGHGVVPEHQMHWSRFYQKPPPQYPQNQITISGQSFPGVNKNQTPWQQPDTRSIFQKALPFHPRKFDQEETRWPILKRLCQTIDAVTQMPERTPDRVPRTTQVRMPEKTSTRKHAQYSPYSSLHTVQGPQSPRTVCAASPEALHVAGDSLQRSEPDNGSHSQHLTPMANITQAQNPDPLELLTTATSSPSCSALQTFANMPPVSDGRPGLSDRLLATARDSSGQSCTGQTDTCADNIVGRAASPVRNQQDHNFPQPFQPEEVESREDNQSETPISVQLQSVPTRNWTQEDLAVLVRDTHQAQAKSHESSVWFDSKEILNTFWKDPRLFLDNLRTGWYNKVMAESTDFCNEHLTLKTPVLSEAKCDLKLSGLQVLQDGEVYSEPVYSSFWRNINQQLDDIDKEFGVAGDFLHHSRFPAPLSPSSPGTAEGLSPEAKPASPEEEPREQEKGDQKLQRAQEPETDSAASVSPSEDPDDVYSFVIEVLPQEQAKAIYESLNHADEAPTKGDLKGSTKPETSVDEGDSERGKEQSNIELESFCEQSKDNLSGFSYSPKQEMVQNDLDDMARGITWEDLDFLLGADAGDKSVDSYHSQDASPPIEHKKDQEMENYATQDFQASEKVTRQDDQEMVNVCQQDGGELVKISQQNDQEMANVCQQDGGELVKIVQQNDHEMANVCQQDDRELAKIVQQNDHETANVCKQDGGELVKIVQQNYHETANVCKQDGGELVKIVQQNDHEMANVCQQDDRELAKVSQQEQEQETKKVPQKDDNQEMANVSQQNFVQEMTNVCRPVLVSPSKVSPEMWPVQGHRGHVEVIPTKLFQGARTLCIADKCLASAKKKRKRTKQSSMNIPCRKKLITKLQRKDVSKHGKETLPENHEMPVELVLFGSARRKPNYTPAHHAPEVLSLSPKGMTSIKQRIYEEWCLPPTKIDGKSKSKSQRKSYADLARKQPPLPILTFGKDKCRMSRTLNKRRSRLERSKDAGALKQADDVMLRTATKCHLGKRHRVSERTPWDHQLRLVAMGTFAGTTAAAWETGSN